MKDVKGKESTKRITIILSDSTVNQIEYIMNVLKIRSYNEVIRTALVNGYSIDSYFEYAKTKANTNVNNFYMNN